MSYTKDRSVYFIAKYDRNSKLWTGQPYESLRFVTKLTRTRTGESNPRWKTQVKAQQNATTPMTGIFESLETKRGSIWFQSNEPSFCQKTTPPFEATWSGDFAAAHMQAIDWVPMSTATAYNRGLIAYLNHVRSVETAFSGMTFLGELKETLGMIRRPAQGLRNILGKYLSDVRRLKGHNPKHWKKNLSSVWLENSFGWQPLFQDVNNAIDAYQEMILSHEQRPVTGFGIEEKFIPSKSGTQNLTLNGTPGVGVRRTTKCTDKAIVRFRGMVKRQVGATPWENRALFGFTANDFIPTVWELLPWSFLVDYFTNIGDVLSANCTSRSSIAWTNVSTVVIQTSENYISTDLARIKSGFGCAFIASCDPSTAIRQKRTVTRSTPSTIGFPTLDFELPGRPAQWANMLALFTQANAIHPQRSSRF